jgi:hypothetical protein
MTEAEQRIQQAKSRYFDDSAKVWLGREFRFLVLLLRALDEAAFAFTMAPNRSDLVRIDRARHLILMGAATALRPILPRVAESFTTSMPRFGYDEAANTHLYACGQITDSLRGAALERYGLANVSIAGEDRIIIEVVSDADEAFERSMARALPGDASKTVAPREKKLRGRKKYTADRLDRYVTSWGKVRSEYWADSQLLDYHNELGRIYAIGNAERQALPPDARLGDRAFSEWADTALTAHGDVLHQVAIATRMRATQMGPDPADFLVRLIRRQDLEMLWTGRGQSEQAARETIRILTLDDATLAHCERAHEVPLPYYVPAGEDHLLAPAFGGLMNPSAGLLWRLRRDYTRDWDRCVDFREPIFRDDLRALFPEPRYLMPKKEIKLVKVDGTDNTDIDAAVVDKSTGALVLIQLKWPDIYGRSLAERDSRRRNVLKANDWVERTATWVNGRSAAEVGREIGLDGAGRRPPELVVLSRHTMRFAGELGYDPRARWISWPTLHTSARRVGRAGILAALREASAPAPQRARESRVITHSLPGLAVEIRSQG